ncbi:MAG: ParB/RepB/Spo0J family partition protein [Bacillota bacterium]|nr:ParB/RepB/Spo0J family partition protein [Bacillota bacterium]
MTKPNYVKRGLSDLLQENTIADLEKEEVIEIPIDHVQPNPYQPRKHFDEAAMNELAESIRINGILQPVIVKKIAQGYMLVTGERRCRAAKMAGFSTVPAIVRDYNNQYLAELALLENIQREDLTIIEEAEAYKNAIDSLQLTHLELAQKIGKSRSYVSNTLGILSLPESIVAEINLGNISMGHARALSKLKDAERIRTIARMIVENRLTVRDIEALVKSEKKKKEIKRKDVPPTLAAGLARLKSSLGLRFAFAKPVRVSGNKIVIAFESDAEAARFAAFVDGENDA